MTKREREQFLKRLGTIETLLHGIVRSERGWLKKNKVIQNYDIIASVGAAVSLLTLWLTEFEKANK